MLLGRIYTLHINTDKENFISIIILRAKYFQKEKKKNEVILAPWNKVKYD